MSSYDNWKLSNPIDDGVGYNMVSRCCGVEMEDSDRSDCCDARMCTDRMMCYECKDHCGTFEVCSECGCDADTIEDYEYEALQKESWDEMRADGERDER
jgi:hypothetical protein